MYAAVRDIDLHDVINAIERLHQRRDYHRAMLAGAARVDLTGEAVGIVTENAAAHARARLKPVCKFNQGAEFRLHDGDHEYTLGPVRPPRHDRVALARDI